MARCWRAAPSPRRSGAEPKAYGYRRLVPPLNAAATAQRAVSTMDLFRFERNWRLA